MAAAAGSDDEMAADELPSTDDVPATGAPPEDGAPRHNTDPVNPAIHGAVLKGSSACPMVTLRDEGVYRCGTPAYCIVLQEPTMAR